MDMSTYLKNELRKHLLRTGSFTKPADLFISLHTAAPGLTGINEATYAAYARQQLDPLDANWSAPADGQASNAVAVTFPAPSSGSQTVTHFGIWDAVTVGNFIGGSALAVPRLLSSLNPGPVFAIGDIDATFDGADLSTYLKNQLRTHLFRTASFTKPTALHVSLHTAAPGLTGANEATYAAYARVSRAPLDANWSAPADGQAENAAILAFPAPSTGSQTVSHFGIWDDVLAGPGNFLMGDALANSRLLDAANPGPEFAAGALDVVFA